MLNVSANLRIFVSEQYTDMRKSFDGLCGCVEQVLGQDPLSGHVFVFFNRRRTMVKMLLWDRSGFCLYCKRLEQGNFSLASLDNRVEIDMMELYCILEGVDLERSRRRKRYSLPT